MKKSTLGHTIAVGFIIVGLGHALANPTGGQVTSGSAGITTAPGTVTVNQASNIAIINWQTFSIGAGETTKFIQPSATSAALNRVLGGQTSVINGTLSANGQVYLINGNGIVIGPGGNVLANTFVASTRDIADADFLNGDLHFTGSSSAGVQNLGKINALGGDVYLIGKTVDNGGTINALNGTVGLAAADDVLLAQSGDSHVFVSSSASASAALNQTAINNSGSINATAAELKAANGNLYALAINNQGTVRATSTTTSGGHIYLTADSGLVQNNGTLAAKNGANGGTVKIAGGSVWNRKTINASGAKGGNVAITAKNVENDGTISVAGTSSTGGNVDITYSGNALGAVSGLIDASGATQGGSIDFLGTGADSEAYLSLSLNASSRLGNGGSININAPSFYLTGAKLNANGYTGGGAIDLGLAGPDASVAASQVAYVSKGTMISANATAKGDGGSVGINGTTFDQFLGSATANGAGAGSAGSITVGSVSTTSSISVAKVTTTGKNTVATKNPATASAASTPVGSAFEFTDPDPSSSDGFAHPGTGLFSLSSNRTLITAPGDNFGGAGAGAAYLFSNANGALLSVVRGNHAGDAVGSTIRILPGGNFAVLTPQWNGDMGAVTFGNGLNGFAGGGGFVTSSNSLLGSTAGDEVGSGGLFSLFNGNVLVLSPDWNNNAGAVTWVNPNAGKSGVVSSSNSLVGAASGDEIASGGIVQLTNGANYLVLSPDWNGGTGAVTNGSDALGVAGVVGAGNSLVGASAGDHVGAGGSVYDTGLGYYLVTSLDWSGGAGAVTWNGDNNATTGTVSSSNSLVGSSPNDQVGSGGITLLPNHNYLVQSPDWNGSAGTVTLGNGATGVTGVVGSTNSYVGAASGDRIGGNGITVLFNNNEYVIDSPDFNGGAGAVTLAGGSLGTSGIVGSSNSLVGASAGDHVGSGGITILDNGNFVVLSPDFNGTAGAVTFENVASGVKGTLTSSNSLVGSNAGDEVGSGGIFLLGNGNNFLVLSPDWGGGKGAVSNGDGVSGISGVVGSGNSLVGASTTDHVGSAGSILDSFQGYYLVLTDSYNNDGGAVTWNNYSGTTGVVGASNSLVGNAGDNVGSNGITFLFNGNYVVSSSDWNNGAGAVTWGSGTAGVHGLVSSSNSFTGSTSGDHVGSGGIIQLPNALNYLVLSPDWNGGAGAVTNLQSNSATSGSVDDTNSLVGASAGDHVGSTGSVISTFDGYYLVYTPDWNGGAGAVTWNQNGNGAVGEVSFANSMVGSSSNDHVGSGGITILADGNYIIDSPHWFDNHGAVTEVFGSIGHDGFFGPSNSAVGPNPGDMVGSGGIVTLPNSDFLILSPNYDNGAGAVTWVDSSVRFHGFLNSANSFTGSNPDDGVGNQVVVLNNGNFLLVSPDWNGGAGAVTWGSEAAGITGTVTSANSLVGSSSTDHVGGAGIQQLSNNADYLVLSPDWNGGAGAVSEGSDSSAISGIVGGANSLIGGSSGDHVGSAGSIFDSGFGYYLVRTADYNSGAGAVTWSSESDATTGVVSSSNSLVGSSAGDNVGASISLLGNGNYLVSSPDWNNDRGAVTFGLANGGVSGAVSSGNSLAGGTAGDRIGSGGIVQLNNGNYVVLSPSFGSSAGAATWGSGLTGVHGLVSSANSLTGGGPNSGMQYAGESADGSIFIVDFASDSSEGGDGRVLAGSTGGPSGSVEIMPNFFLDQGVISVEASNFDIVTNASDYTVTDPSAVKLDPVSVDNPNGGAVNHGSGHNIAGGSSTSTAPGTNRLVTPGNGVWNIAGGMVHSAPPPQFVTQQFQVNLNPQVYSHLHQVLFGNP